jgi:hypothetical protein
MKRQIFQDLFTPGMKKDIPDRKKGRRINQALFLNLDALHPPLLWTS